jgi:hypothetical protein
MGAGGSKPSLQKGDTYAISADTSRKLADEILKIFFTRADFKDLLSLASLSSCSTYVFTTAEALNTLFQTLKVYPSLGKKGEVLFAPVRRLSPGLLPIKEMDQTTAAEIENRNKVCMDVAYFYVRIFQIYAALALTVLDTDPTRKRTGVVVPKQQQQRAVFFGGAFELRAIGQSIQKQIMNTPFAPILDSFKWNTRVTNETNLILELNRASFSINWDNSSSQIGSDELSMDGYFSKVNSIAIRITMKYESPSNNTQKNISKIIMSIDENPIIEFSKNLIGANTKWYVKCIFNPDLDLQTSASATETEKLKNCLNLFFQTYSKTSDQYKTTNVQQRVAGVGGIQGYGAQIRPVQVTVPTGASTFQGFDEIKKVFDKRFKGEDFPKAYCIARAMTLLNPLFENEKLSQNQPSYSQICKQKLDFEVTDAMPRADKTPAANIYLKSLVSLFYDSYTIKGNQVTFTASETGRTDLRNASVKLAALYNITDKPEQFIESSSRFKSFGICSKNSNREIQINDKAFRNALENDVIKPMLAFQAEHTKKVNALLLKMFDVRADVLRFQPYIRQGGKEAILQLAREAHALLLDYYLKSEAYYIKGVLMFEKPENLKSFTFI